MGKWYAYCPRGFVELIEKRTEAYPEEAYPIGRFYHGSLLPFFREIPETQKAEVKLLWYWDDADGCFKEPEVGQEVGGQIYIGVIPKERIYELMQSNLQLKNRAEQNEADWAETAVDLDYRLSMLELGLS